MYKRGALLDHKKWKNKNNYLMKKEKCYLLFERENLSIAVAVYCCHAPALFLTPCGARRGAERVAETAHRCESGPDRKTF